jgi:N-acetylmuramoyl-L-alanine amidase
LEFSSDDRGPYAGYRLQAGEALYSAVVVRFTGRTAAEDVRTLAELLQDRSDVRDLRDIPVGYEIRIPLDLLEPEFLPTGHPRRQEAEARERELARALARQPVVGTRGGLKGVLVVLDPGHGGRDLGTINNGIWEHDYVYDVACRLKRKLETGTAAKVVLTLEDLETGCVPSATDKLKANQQGTVLTTPPFLAEKEGEAKIGVNLRWYLANSVYRRAVADGHDPDRVVFISLHADSRHASLSGAMVYVPGAAYRTRTYGHNSDYYRRFQEVREKPQVHFSKTQRVRSEAVSREFANSVVEAFRNEELPVQPHQPVRHRIIRGKSRFVPAVLRGNSIPNKVLVEMVNLSNPDDAALLASANKRDRLATGLLNSLFDYFGETPLAVATSSGAR